MKLTKEELKDLYQQWKSCSSQPPGDCLTDEVLLRAATGALGRSERKRVADHLMQCSDCARNYRLAGSLKPWVEQVAQRPVEPRMEVKVNESRWKAALQILEELLAGISRRQAAVLAATFMVAVAVLITLRQATPPGDESAPGERASVSTAMDVEPPNRAILREPPKQMAWPVLEPRDRYQVILYDFESTPIWESPVVREATVLLPEAIRNRLQRGRPIYWRVFTQDGVERRQSELFQFTLAPDANR